MQAPPKRWKKRRQLKPEHAAALQETLADLKLSPLVLQILVNRQIIDLRPPAAPGEDDADRPPPPTPAELHDRVAAFVSPVAAPLPSPFTIPGVEAAVERLARALQGQEKIAVYGDYDADGVTSTVLLTRALRAFGAETVIHVPHRKRDGYGLNIGALDALADEQVRLVVTVDCGISNVAEVTHAQGRGLDLIVTDHHDLPQGGTPNAIIINPKLGAKSDIFAHLSGVGVAHQLVRALVERLGKPPTLRNNDLLELVAIGTVADVAVLLGANRTLVAQGLTCLRNTRRPGLLALLECAGVKPAAITTHTLGFIIGPRLNAAGRLDDASLATDLLLADDPAVARDLARRLETENARRQELTRAVVEQARAQVAALPDDEPVIIVRDKSWDVGVVGLAAGRLCEEFARPTVVLVDEGEKSRGSARSTRYFNIHDLLQVCEDMLDHFGGHPAAAGLTLPSANYAEFCERLGELVESDITSETPLSGEYQADYELALGQVTVETLADLAVLEPCGHGNDRPLFVARNLRVLEATANGKDGRTLILQVAPPGEPGPAPLRAVGFGLAPEWMPKLAARPPVDMLFRLALDEWQGQQQVRLFIEALRLSKG